MAIRAAGRRQRTLLKRAAVSAEVRYGDGGGFRSPGQLTQRVKCGRVRWAPVVEVRRGREGGAWLHGLVSCANTVGCPTCAVRALRAKGEELKSVVSGWERELPGRAWLLTLTVRHTAADSAAALRDAVMGAWRSTLQGKEAQEWRESAGVAGWCRRLEVTHGPNGPHPHLHVLLLFEHRPTAAELDAVTDRFWERWSVELGARGFDCERSVGVVLTRADRGGAYLTKMGLGIALELSSEATKTAKGKNRTMLRVLLDYARYGRERDGRLWQNYVECWRGRRPLEWSRTKRTRAIRKQLGSPQLTLPLVEATPRPADVMEVIPGQAWDGSGPAGRGLRDRWTERLALLERAERPKALPLTADAWARKQVEGLGIPWDPVYTCIPDQAEVVHLRAPIRPKRVELPVGGERPRARGDDIGAEQYTAQLLRLMSRWRCSGYEAMVIFDEARERFARYVA